MQYTTTIHWQRDAATPFNERTYDRTHTVQFGGGLKTEASSAPEFLGNAALPNPEELFTASIASCLMLTFLYWAAKEGLPLLSYQAEAVGKLGKTPEGKMAMTEVVLKPTLTFQDNQQPDTAQLDALFKKAHEQCFISNSVKTNVMVETAQCLLA